MADGPHSNASEPAVIPTVNEPPQRPPVPPPPSPLTAATIAVFKSFSFALVIAIAMLVIAGSTFGNDDPEGLLVVFLLPFIATISLVCGAAVVWYQTKRTTNAETTAVQRKALLGFLCLPVVTALAVIAFGNPEAAEAMSVIGVLLALPAIGLSTGSGKTKASLTVGLVVLLLVGVGVRSIVDASDERSTRQAWLAHQNPGFVDATELDRVLPGWTIVQLHAPSTSIELRTDKSAEITLDMSQITCTNSRGWFCEYHDNGLEVGYFDCPDGSEILRIAQGRLRTVRIDTSAACDGREMTADQALALLAIVTPVTDEEWIAATS